MSENYEDKIRNISSRLGWRNTRNFLGKGLGITAQGLDPFITRVNEAVSGNDDIGNAIDTFWKNLIFSGDRLIKLYRLEDEEISRLQTGLSKLLPDESSFNEAYPAPVSKGVLENCDTQLHFAETQDEVINDKIVESTILLSKAYYSQYIELDAEHLSDQGMELKENGGEIKCKTREVTQCFNTVILIPSDNLLIITIDLSILPRSESAHQQFLVERFVREVSQVRLARPIDLFPTIQDMYEKVDGRVSQMTFITADGNSSSLKLKPSQQCLRRDSYHHGGESASPILTKYKLGKIWDIAKSPSMTVSVELTLPGKRAMLDDPKKYLFDATIQSSPSLDCLIFVVDKLLTSLSSIEASRLAKI